LLLKENTLHFALQWFYFAGLLGILRAVRSTKSRDRIGTESETNIEVGKAGVSISENYMAVTGMAERWAWK
jgi:hypothetical protein